MNFVHSVVLMAEHPKTSFKCGGFFFCYMDATFSVYVRVYALACIDALVCVDRLQSFVCIKVFHGMNALRTPCRGHPSDFFLLSSSFSSRIFNEIDFLESAVGTRAAFSKPSEVF